MKVTTDNYTSTVKQIGLRNLPAELQEAHHYLKQASKNFTNWQVAGADFAEVKKLAFDKLKTIADSLSGLNGKNDPPYIQQAKEDAQEYKWMDPEQLKRIYMLEISAIQEEDSPADAGKIRLAAIENLLKGKDKKWALERKQLMLGDEFMDSVNTEQEENPNYDAFNEIQFIEKFIALNNTIVTKKQIKLFIEQVQEAIKEKRIRKFSPFATEIYRVQEEAISFYRNMKGAAKLALPKKFLGELESAVLKYFNSKNEEPSEEIKPETLSGTEQTAPESTIIPSEELSKKEFVTIGFTGKWLRLMGDPTRGFTAMVFGKPKMGKSFLCVDFAGYLAKNFGKVLYVTKEEKHAPTFIIKLKEKNAMHENLFIADSLPEDISMYDFIFLDSVSAMGLTPDQLRELKEKNPGKSFVFIFQTTKAGNFRGVNTFQHDVDIIIEVPERGKAIQNGRFNQGGEMNIFEEDEIQHVENIHELAGVDKHKKSKPKGKSPKRQNMLDEPQDSNTAPDMNGPGKSMTFENYRSLKDQFDDHSNFLLTDPQFFTILKLMQEDHGEKIHSLLQSYTQIKMEFFDLLEEGIKRYEERRIQNLSGDNYTPIKVKR